MGTISMTFIDSIIGKSSSDPSSPLPDLRSLQSSKDLVPTENVRTPIAATFEWYLYPAIETQFQNNLSFRY